LNVFYLLFRIFEQLALALKNRGCPGIFHCLEYTFYILNFWATSACPEKQSCPAIFHCTEIYFIIQVFEQLAVALKTEFILKFFKPGGAGFLGFEQLRFWANALGFCVLSKNQPTICSVFIFLRRFKLAHIHIQVIGYTLHNGGTQGIDRQIFNRKSISGKITHPHFLFESIW